MTLVSRFSLIAADLIGLYITWYRTHETLRLARHDRLSGGHGKPTFSFTLLRDGAYDGSALKFSIAHSRLWQEPYIFRQSLPLRLASSECLIS